MKYSFVLFDKGRACFFVKLRDVLSSSNPGFNNLAVGNNKGIGNTAISLRREEKSVSKKN